MFRREGVVSAKFIYGTSLEKIGKATHLGGRALIVRDLRRHEAICNSRQRSKPTQAVYGPNFTRGSQGTDYHNRVPHCTTSRLKITAGQIRRC